jgi:hypothetical protein
MPEPEIKEGYTPGLIGRLTSLHARYYNRLWALGPSFERAYLWTVDKTGICPVSLPRRRL